MSSPLPYQLPVSANTHNVPMWSRAEAQASSSCCCGTFSGGGCGGSSSVLLSSGSFSFRRGLLALDAVNGISWSFGLDYLAGNGVTTSWARASITRRTSASWLVRRRRRDPGQRPETQDTFTPSGGGYSPASGNCTQAELSHGGAGTCSPSRASDGTLTLFSDFEHPPRPAG